MHTFNDDVAMHSGHPRWAGTTRWNINFIYTVDDSEGKCRFTDPRVYLSIRYRMPKLSNPHQNSAITSTFKRYYDQLMKHEQGHGDSGRLAAAKIDELLDKAYADDCVVLVQQSQERAKAIIKEYRRRDKRYDMITDHGRKQNRLQPGMLNVP